MGSLKFGTGALRNAGAGLVAAVCFLFLSKKLEGLDGTALVASVAGVGFWQWIGALAATALSFAVIGQYDALFHGWLRTGVSPRRGCLAGASAIAVSQTVGFGLATGTLARWRILPDLTTAQALRLTSYVSFSFIAALGFLTSATLALIPDAGIPGTGLIAALALLSALAYPAMSLWCPNWLPFALPPAGLMLRLVGLTALDVLFAALALYALMPDNASLPFAHLFAAYAIALGAGLISGSPGGIGPFELCLIALLPGQAPADVVTAILAFRLVYYGLPACLGALCMAAPLEPTPRNPVPAVSHNGLRAESAGLSRQAGHCLQRTGKQVLHLARTNQSLVSLAEPTGGTLRAATLTAFAQEAQAETRTPALYKIGARSAAMARRLGWATVVISEEAWLDPRTFTLETPARRQLRRKLRNVGKSGAKICEMPTLPITEMARVARDWATSNGGERGFSMNRYDPDTIKAQRCFLAYHGSELVAFASFNTSSNDWSLDLMRQTSQAPDGTMHALIAAAVEAARQDGIPRLSLAAMPLADPSKHLAACQRMTGLRQFKLSFAPETRRLYLAAPSWLSLAVAALDILFRIREPAASHTARFCAALQKLHGGFPKLAVVKRPMRAQIDLERDTCTNEVTQ